MSELLLKTLRLVRDELLRAVNTSTTFTIRTQHIIDGTVPLPSTAALTRKYDTLFHEVKAAHSHTSSAPSAGQVQADSGEQTAATNRSTAHEQLHQEHNQHASRIGNQHASGQNQRRHDQHNERECIDQQKHATESLQGAAFNVRKLSSASKNQNGSPKKKAAGGKDVLSAKPSSKKKKKEGRRWSEEAASAADVDKTEGASSASTNSAGLARPVESRMDDGLSTALSDGNDELRDENLAQRLLKKAGGGGNVNEADLKPLLEGLRNKLLEKNVAEEAASALCDSLKGELSGKKLPALSRLSKEVDHAMQRALTRVLSPASGASILREAKKRQRSGRFDSEPYVVVFAGVNGVGKSTTLAKVASWLLSNGVQLSVAACDTFRAGAVEQLRTHCTRLGVSLHEKGYGKDASRVAKEAVANASKEGEGCVLIDTAGRMQHNEQLMRELAAIVRNTGPHMVLFVGEALVGNDGVDQLRQFNRRLRELTSGPGATPRGIDGIALTKMDTIDDKAGAAVSMSHVSNAPIMFAGVGQTYADLVPLPVETVVRSLLR